MRVNIKLLGWMREFLAEGIAHFNDQDFELPIDFTLAQLVAKFGFASETPFIVMQNGNRVLDEAFAVTLLREGDQILFVPPLKGG